MDMAFVMRVVPREIRRHHMTAIISQVMHRHSIPRQSALRKTHTALLIVVPWEIRKHSIPDVSVSIRTCKFW
jgi:hypothetical protein